MNFIINNSMWQVQAVNSTDVSLQKSDKTYSVGVADKNTRTIYLSDRLHGVFLRKVLMHEVCHAICMSYEIYLPIEQEEVVCDFVATYGDEVFEIVDIVLGAVRRVG